MKPSLTLARMVTCSRLRLILAGLLTTIAAQAAVVQTVTFDTFSGNPSLPIPDGNIFGVSDARVVTSSIKSLDWLEVNLSVSGSFTGDLYIYLRHDDGFSVLLNRPGRSSSLPFGYDDAGISVTFSDIASGGNFHTYRDTVTPAAGTALTGNWRPDGLEVVPVGDAALYDSAIPTALLDSFKGKDPNGTWTLYAADLSEGAMHEIDSWSLIFHGLTPVPEPAEITATVAAALVAWAGWRRVRRSS